MLLIWHDHLTRLSTLASTLGDWPKLVHIAAHRCRVRENDLLCMPSDSRSMIGEVRQEECLDLLIALNSGLPEV